MSSNSSKLPRARNVTFRARAEAGQPGWLLAMPGRAETYIVPSWHNSYPCLAGTNTPKHRHTKVIPYESTKLPACHDATLMTMLPPATRPLVYRNTFCPHWPLAGPYAGAGNAGVPTHSHTPQGGASATLGGNAGLCAARRGCPNAPAHRAGRKQAGT